MADIKTNIRELSVGFHFFGAHEISSLSPISFLRICRNNITNCENLTIKQISSYGSAFNEEELAIIQNGLTLGEVIEDLFKIKPNPHVSWTGCDTHSGNAIDLSINGHGFSLKEESHILENMGLYKLVNIIQNANTYKRGLHIFEEFAPGELEDWFKTTRDLLIKIGPSRFEYRGGGYTSLGQLEDGKTLRLFYQQGRTRTESIIRNFDSSGYDAFQRQTTSMTREKVFSKWIKERIEHNSIYLKSKKVCALMAGARLVTLLKPYIKTSPPSLNRLFRIDKEEYYYAKSTFNETFVYQVPKLNEFRNQIFIKNIEMSVPKHQLNIYTTIQNKETDKQLVFRNELRYSHGQFNGTPEAKFYIAQGDITTLYKRLFSK
jgi:hypothetical protein